MIIKSVLVGATAIAIALTSFNVQPVAAAPLGGPAKAQSQSDATDVSAQRKRKRGYRGNPAVPLAAFGAIIGTIGAVAAANSRRDYYERPYYGPRAYGYYDGPPAYHYAPPAYHSAPVYGHRGYQRDYYSRWGGSGGQPGYRGPNVNVPGPTNYGNAAGQNGQAPPPTPMAPVSGGHL